MARQLRVEFPGAIYHVTSRMVGDAAVGGASWPFEKRLFRDDADYERFLERLGERVEQFNVRLYLFVCMTNHFHLVLETPEANCSKFMQSLSTAYTIYYNLRHGRHGHLLDGRYKARLVEGDDYLRSLSRYVHLNPVQVSSQGHKPIKERIKNLRAHRWSSYPSYIGDCKGFDFVEYGPLLEQMTPRRGSGQSGRQRAYREFVESGLAESDEDFKLALRESPRSIGSAGFRAWIDELYQKRVETHARPEDVSFRHNTEPLSPETVLRCVAETLGVDERAFMRRTRRSVLRSVAARFLIRYAGLSQRDAARYLGIGSGSAVCNQLKRLALRLEADRLLRKQVKEIGQTLEATRCSQTKQQNRICGKVY